jgi:queuosine biosynthesis protein QueC
MNKETVLLLASGGMDSTVLAHKLLQEGYRIKVLFFDYAQHFRDREYAQLLKLLPTELSDNIVTIDISSIYNSSESIMIKQADLWNDVVKANDLYLPYRNLVFLTLASAYAQSNCIYTIYAAFIDSNNVKEIDCSMEFFKNLNQLLGDLGNVTIKLPFRNMTKLEVAKLGVSLGVDIASTYSCQVNSNYHCGSCPNCVDRQNAINNL